jgi:O-acetyl-ADP-ribose deacetylase (regulator of RNase III)
MYPFVFRPTLRVAMQDLSIELWVAQRKMPLLMRAQGIIVPVAPDLKMVFGVAKMVRDYGADKVQYEANRVAPLAPGEAFVGTGARYKYKYTALAVIFDEAKRTSPELITSAMTRAAQLLQERGVRSVVIPDMTENLLTQPPWITPEQRAATAEITARITIDAILAAGAHIRSVKLWCWERANAEIFRRELERLKARERSARALSSS